MATIKGNKNRLGECICRLIDSLAALGAALGVIPKIPEDVDVKWHDNVIIDDNTIIDNNIKLYNSGLRSKISAVMEVNKCSEEEAKVEIERINAEMPINDEQKAFDDAGY